MELNTRTKSSESSQWCCTVLYVHHTSEVSVPGCDVGCGTLWDLMYLLHLLHQPSHTITYNTHTNNKYHLLPIPSHAPVKTLTLSPPVPGHHHSMSTVSTGQCLPADTINTTNTTKITPLHHTQLHRPIHPTRRCHANCQNLQLWIPRCTSLGGEEQVVTPSRHGYRRRAPVLWSGPWPG